MPQSKWFSLKKSVQLAVAVALFAQPMTPHLVHAQTPNRIEAGATERNAALIGTSAQDIARVEVEYDQFLRRLGFADHVADARRSLPNARDASARAVLRQNIESFEIINLARDLSTYITARILPQFESGNHNRSGEAQAKALELTMRLWHLRPYEAGDEFRNEVETIKNDPVQRKGDIPNETRVAAKLANAEDKARRNANPHKDRVVADVIEAIYGTAKVEEILNHKPAAERDAFLNEMRFLEEKVKKYVHKAYNDKELGTTRWLGRAMVSNLVRYSRLQAKTNGAHKDLESRLARKMAAVGENMYNYVSDKLEVADKDGKKVSVVIETGDIINETSKEGQFSFDLTAITTPKIFASFKSFLRGMFKGVSGNPLTRPFVRFFLPDTDKTAEEIEMAHQMNAWDRFKHFIAQHRSVLARGFTHVGQSVVYADQETGIKAVYVFDMYPNAGPGGVRQIGLEGFSIMHPQFTQTAITKLDVEKMRHLAREQIKEKGYDPTLWKATGSYYRNGEWIENKDLQDNLYLTDNDRNTHMKILYEMNPVEAKQAYQSRIEQIWRRYATGADAKGFAAGFISSAKAYFCSQTTQIAIKYALYLDSTAPSRYTLMHNLVRVFMPELVKNLDFDNPLISPNALTVNHDIVYRANLFKQDGFVRIIHPGWRINEFETALTLHEPRRRPMSNKMYQMLSGHLTNDFTTEDFSARAQAYYDQILWSQGVRTMFGYSSYATPAQIEGQMATQRTNDGTSNDLRSNVEIGSQRMTQSMRTADAWSREMRDFLVNYGFEDGAAQIREEMRRQPPVDPNARARHAENIKSAQGVNAARELALLFFSRVHDRMKRPNQMKLINELTARVLALQRKSVDRQIPAEVIALPEGTDEEKRRKKNRIEEIIADQLKMDIESTTRMLVSEFLRVIYGENVVKYLDPAAPQTLGTETERAWADLIQKDAARIYSLAGRVVNSMYLDAARGSSRGLGRAMALLTARIAEKSQSASDADFMKSPIMQDLGHHIRHQGMRIEMFIGSSVVVQDKDGKWSRPVAVKTGDVAPVGYYQVYASKHSKIRSTTVVDLNLRPVADSRDAVNAHRTQISEFMDRNITITHSLKALLPGARFQVVKNWDVGRLKNAVEFFLENTRAQNAVNGMTPEERRREIIEQQKRVADQARRNIERQQAQAQSQPQPATASHSDAQICSDLFKKAN